MNLVFHRKAYLGALLGFLLGLSFPFLAFFIELTEHNLPLNLHSWLEIHSFTSSQWLSDILPFIFSIVGYFLGNAYDQRPIFLRENLSLQVFQDKIQKAIIFILSMTVAITLISLLLPHNYLTYWSSLWGALVGSIVVVFLMYGLQQAKHYRRLMHALFATTTLIFSSFVYATGGTLSPYNHLFILVILLGTLYYATLEDLAILLLVTMVGLSAPLFYTHPFPLYYLWDGIVFPLIYYTLAGIIILIAMKEMVALWHTLETDKKELSAIQEAGQHLTSQLEYQDAVQAIVDQVNRLMGSQFTFLAIPRAGTEFYPIAKSGEDQGYTAKVRISTSADSIYGQGPAGRAIREKVPIHVQDVITDPTFAPWRYEAYQRGIQSVVAVPIIIEGEVEGVLLSYAKEKDFFSPEKISLLRSLADFASIAMVNAHLYQKSQYVSQRLATLQKANIKLYTTLNIEEVYQQVALVAKEIFGTPKVILRLYDPEQNLLYSKIFEGFSQEYQHLDQQVPLGTGPCGVAALEKRVIQTPNLGSNPLYRGREAHFHLGQYVLEQAIPLMNSHGKLLGTLSVYFDSWHAPSNEELLVAELFGMGASIAIEKTLVYQDVEEARNQFDILFNNASDAILVHNLEGRILKINDRTYQWLGYSRNELLNLPITHIIESQTQETPLQQRWQEAREKGGILFETSYRKKDGTLLPVEVSLRIISMETEEVVQISARDLTEKKKARAELQQAYEELVRAEKLAAIGETVMTITHHISNALTPITGFSQLLLKRFPPDSSEHAWIKILLSKAEEIATVVSSLQNMEKYDTISLGGVSLLNIHQPQEKDKKKYE